MKGLKFCLGAVSEGRAGDGADLIGDGQGIRE